MKDKFTLSHLRQLLISRLVILALLILGISPILTGCRKKTFKEMESFHPSGKVWERWYEDNDGFKQGKAQTYYENGQLQTEAQFVNGYLEGEFVMWSRNGKELSRGIYKKGDPWSGTFISVDDRQQQVVFKSYKNGNPVE